VCGSGGGGDGGAADRERERERKNAAAIASINAIFGLDDPSLYNIPQTRQVPIRIQSSEDPAIFEDRGYRTEEFTATDTAKIEQAKTNKAAREQLYSTSREDILNYFKKQLEEQQSREERLAREQFAQRGWTGGAHEISYGKDYEKAVQDALFNIGTRADTAVSDIRALDEKARQNLISQILSGMDEQSAITGATSALRQNVDTAKSAALQQSLGDVFGDIADLYNLRTRVDAERRIRESEPFRSVARTIYDPASYAGTIT